MKRIILISVLFLFLCGCTVTAGTIADQNQDEAITVANEFLVNMLRGNFDSAYNKYCLEDFKKTASFEKFKDMSQNDFRGNDKITKVTFEYLREVPLPNKAIQLFYQANYESSATAEFNFVMETNSQGQYKIYSLNGDNLFVGNFPKIYKKGSIEITAEGVKKGTDR